MLAHDERPSLPKPAIMQTDVGADDRNWAIYANAAGLLVFTNIPFANVIGPLLIWLKVRNDPAMPFAREHARVALNFQITWTLVFAIAVAACVALFSFTMETVVAYLALVVANLVLCILGCARASDLRPPANVLAIPFVR